MRRALLLVSFLFLPFVLRTVHAQVGLQPDSISRSRVTAFDTLTAAKSDTLPKAYVPAKSPGTALLLSAILPGAGQIYNQSYWKAPIIFGLGVYFVAEWLHNNRLTNDWRARYTESLSTSPGGNSSYLAVREFYKDQRDSFAWYFFILYIVNLADAYVDASLFDFDVGSSLSIKMRPMELPSGPGAFALNWRITF